MLVEYYHNESEPGIVWAICADWPIRYLSPKMTKVVNPSELGNVSIIVFGSPTILDLHEFSVVSIKFDHLVSGKALSSINIKK